MSATLEQPQASKQSAKQNADQSALASPPLSPFRPVQWEEHEKDKAKRAAERAKKQPELLRCLDPKYAAKVEAAKPTYDFCVTASWTTQDRTTGMAKQKSATHEVNAHDEHEAWAMFCDLAGCNKGRRYCDYKIELISSGNGP